MGTHAERDMRLDKRERIRDSRDTQLGMKTISLKVSLRLDLERWENLPTPNRTFESHGGNTIEFNVIPHAMRKTKQ